MVANRARCALPPGGHTHDIRCISNPTLDFADRRKYRRASMTALRGPASRDTIGQLGLTGHWPLDGSERLQWNAQQP